MNWNSNSHIQTIEAQWKVCLVKNGKDVHIVVPFAYLLLSCSKFELKLLRAENVAVQAR